MLSGADLLEWPDNKAWFYLAEMVVLVGVGLFRRTKAARIGELSVFVSKLRIQESG